MHQRTRWKRPHARSARAGRSLVVVGGGIAGVSCAEELAALCPDDHVTLVSASAVLKGATNVVRLTEHLDDFDVVPHGHAYARWHACYCAGFKRS